MKLAEKHTIGSGNDAIIIKPSRSPDKIQSDELIFFHGFHIKYGNGKLEWWESSDLKASGLRVPITETYAFHILKPMTPYETDLTIADGKIKVDIRSQDQKVFYVYFAQ